MLDLILIGGGGHCKSVIDVVEQTKRFNIVGIVEKLGSKIQKVSGYDVIGNDDDLSELLKSTPQALVTIGQIKSCHARMFAYQVASSLGAQLPSVISPYSYVSSQSQIGSGTVVMHDAIINSCATVGENVILNSKCLVEHDVKIGDHCHISTGALINGDVMIEDGCFIGSGVVLRNGIKVGANSVIGMGSIVSTDVVSGSFIR